MRNACLLVVGLLVVVLFSFTAEAKGVKLTQDQVATVCGKGSSHTEASQGARKPAAPTKSMFASMDVSRARAAREIARRVATNAPWCFQVFMPVAWSNSLYGMRGKQAPPGGSDGIHVPRLPTHFILRR